MYWVATILIIGAGSIAVRAIVGLVTGNETTWNPGGAMAAAFAALFMLLPIFGVLDLIAAMRERRNRRARQARSRQSPYD